MSVENFVCICLDNVVPCGSNYNHMTKEFGKYVSKHLKSLGNEKELIVTGYNIRVSVQISSVIAPTDNYSPFRVNVKVIKSEYNMLQYSEYGFALRDENKKYIRKWGDRIVRRSDVNGLNHNIRNQVERRLADYTEIFGFNRWNVKVEKVAHLR